MDKKAKKSLLEITSIHTNQRALTILSICKNQYKISILAKATKEEITY